MNDNIPQQSTTYERSRGNGDDEMVDVVDASSPFDRPDADVILRSCDHVDFRFHKSLLSLASPFFCNMFALPQPPSLPTTTMAGTTVKGSGSESGSGCGCVGVEVDMWKWE